MRKKLTDFGNILNGILIKIIIIIFHLQSVREKNQIKGYLSNLFIQMNFYNRRIVYSKVCMNIIVKIIYAKILKSVFKNVFKLRIFQYKCIA